MQRILVASGNAKKLAELSQLCASLPVQILSPIDLPTGLPEVIEDGDNFLDNARKKALAFALAAQQQLGPDVWALADDSGLCVDALDGAPGVYSSRYAQMADFAGAADASHDQRNNQYLMQQLAGLPAEQRGAAFWCVIAVAKGDELLFAVEGSVTGRILEAPIGDQGFGYDPLFFHEPSQSSFGHLSSAEKATLSHRGQAVARLHSVLTSVLPTAASSDR
jgi:XTP/dITP diphosphohydrolase